VSELTAKKPNYGNWVSKRLLYVPGAISILLAGLSFLFPVLAVLAVIIFLCFAYFAYARYQFSPKGGNFQAKIQGLLLDYFEWDGEGKAIDIGCGNGPLTIMIGKKYPNAQVTGIDYWGARGNIRKVFVKGMRR
jgi:hypothetical protein